MRKVRTSKLHNKLNQQSLRSSSSASLSASFKEKNDMGAPELAPIIMDAQTIKDTQDALNNGASASGAPGVDKIRELLFGNQMQDYDRRFAVIEERFQQKMRDMEAESARALQ